MPDFQTLLYDVDADGVAIVTLNRPDKLNALSRELLSELPKAMRAARNDSGVKGIVVTGAGEKAFAAGANIEEFTELDPIQAQRFSLIGQNVFSSIENMPKPVIAAVNGFALGGGMELAMACHLRVASENAQFGQPEVQLGLIPGYGGTQRLPRLVGRGIAAELLLTGDRIRADRAHQIGLVNHVVPAAELMDKAKALIRDHRVQGAARRGDGAPGAARVRPAASAGTSDGGSAVWSVRRHGGFSGRRARISRPPRPRVLRAITSDLPGSSIAAASTPVDFFDVLSFP